MRPAVLVGKPLGPDCVADLRDACEVLDLPGAADPDALPAEAEGRIRAIAGGKANAAPMARLPALEIIANAGLGIAIVDALTEGELRAIGRAARGLPLVTGGSGVAIGGPANFDAAARPGGAASTATSLASGREAVLAGSCAGATRGQVAAAVAAGVPVLRVDPLEIAAGRLRPEDAAAFASAATGPLPPLVASSDDPAGVARVAAAPGREAAGTPTEALFGRLAVLLADRGPVVSGRDLKSARFAIEELEETARLFLLPGDRAIRPPAPDQAAPLRPGVAA